MGLLQEKEKDKEGVNADSEPIYQKRGFEVDGLTMEQVEAARIETSSYLVDLAEFGFSVQINGEGIKVMPPSELPVRGFVVKRKRPGVR